MKTRTCVCGHNFFSHDERTKHAWKHIFTNRITMIVSFSRCNIAGCRCENFLDKEEPITLRKK